MLNTWNAPSVEYKTKPLSHWRPSEGGDDDASDDDDNEDGDDDNNYEDVGDEEYKTKQFSHWLPLFTGFVTCYVS